MGTDSSLSSSSIKANEKRIRKCPSGIRPVSSKQSSSSSKKSSSSSRNKKSVSFSKHETLMQNGENQERWLTPAERAAAMRESRRLSRKQELLQKGEPRRHQDVDQSAHSHGVPPEVKVHSTLDDSVTLNTYNTFHTASGGTHVSAMTAQFSVSDCRSCGISDLGFPWFQHEGVHDRIQHQLETAAKQQEGKGIRLTHFTAVRRGFPGEVDSSTYGRHLPPAFYGTLQTMKERFRSEAVDEVCCDDGQERPSITTKMPPLPSQEELASYASRSKVALLETIDALEKLRVKTGESLGPTIERLRVETEASCIQGDAWCRDHYSKLAETTTEVHREVAKVTQDCCAGAEFDEQQQIPRLTYNTSMDPPEGDSPSIVQAPTLPEEKEFSRQADQAMLKSLRNAASVFLDRYTALISSIPTFGAKNDTETDQVVLELPDNFYVEIENASLKSNKAIEVKESDDLVFVETMESMMEKDEVLGSQDSGDTQEVVVLQEPTLVGAQDPDGVKDSDDCSVEPSRDCPSRLYDPNLHPEPAIKQGGSTLIGNQDSFVSINSQKSSQSQDGVYMSKSSFSHDMAKMSKSISQEDVYMSKSSQEDLNMTFSGEERPIGTSPSKPIDLNMSDSVSVMPIGQSPSEPIDLNMALSSDSVDRPIGRSPSKPIELPMSASIVGDKPIGRSPSKPITVEESLAEDADLHPKRYDDREAARLEKASASVWKKLKKLTKKKKMAAVNLMGDLVDELDRESVFVASSDGIVGDNGSVGTQGTFQNPIILMEESEKIVEQRQDMERPMKATLGAPLSLSSRDAQRLLELEDQSQISALTGLNSHETNGIMTTGAVASVEDKSNGMPPRTGLDAGGGYGPSMRNYGREPPMMTTSEMEYDDKLGNDFSKRNEAATKFLSNLKNHLMNERQHRGRTAAETYAVRKFVNTFVVEDAPIAPHTRNPRIDLHHQGVRHGHWDDDDDEPQVLQAPAINLLNATSFFNGVDDDDEESEIRATHNSHKKLLADPNRNGIIGNSQWDPTSRNRVAMERRDDVQPSARGADVRQDDTQLWFLQHHDQRYENRMPRRTADPPRPEVFRTSPEHPHIVESASDTKSISSSILGKRISRRKSVSFNLPEDEDDSVSNRASHADPRLPFAPETISSQAVAHRSVVARKELARLSQRQATLMAQGAKLAHNYQSNNRM